ncbi:MAG: SdpI family protein [Spirochaetales bacterium]
MSENEKGSKFALFGAVLSLLGMLAIFPLLPSSIPLHWNWEGKVDRLGSRWHILWIAAAPLFLYLLMGILPTLDPKSQSYQKHARAYRVFRGLLTLVFIGFGWIPVAAALGARIDVGILVRVIIGILFLGLGNYMGQLRHNYFVGIRTPWTLADERVWQKTHRRGSWVFVMMGIVFLGSLGVPSKVAGIGIAMVSVLLGVGYLVGYSFWLFRQGRSGNPQKRSS